MSLPDWGHLSPWQASELAADTLTVAPALLGSYLLRELDGQLLVGRIVETEAYLPNDPACHAFKGETPRNRPMFGPPGRAYVYRIYGLHYCFNVVTEPEGVGAAVLVRAVEPLVGLAVMAERRGRKDLTNGPGKLAQAMGLDLALNGHDVTRPGPLVLLKPEAPPPRPIATSPRIGITQGAELPWRFFYAGHPCVSKGPMARP